MLATLALAGCGSTGAPSRHEIIDSRDNYDPRSLDPALSTDVPTGRAVGYVFDGLTRFTPDAKVEPALAERWDVTPDGLTYTFHLRRGVTFHDGSPFTARTTSSHSWQRALDPGDEERRGAVPLPDQRRAGVQRRLGEERSPGSPCATTARSSSTLAEPLAIFTKMLAMPVAAVVPDNAAGELRRASDRQRAVEAR